MAKVRTRKQLTHPLMSLHDGQTLTFKVLGEVEPMMLPKPGGDGLQETMVLPVVNLDTGEESRLIIPALLDSLFQRLGKIPVGMYIEMKDRGMRSGKNYRDIEISEVEVE